MKSRFRITVAAIGLASTVIISAAAAPLSDKIVAVDSLVNTGVSDEITELPIVNSEETTVENTFMLLELDGDNKKVDTTISTSSQTQSTKPSTNQSSSTQSNKGQNSTTPESNKSEGASQDTSVNAPSEETAPQTPASPQISGPTFTFPTTPVVLPVVRDGGNVAPTFSDESGEILWVQDQKLPVKEALKRIVSNEVNNMNYEAIKAQVVASHTYVKYYNDLGGSASVGMKSSYVVGGDVDRAVEEVYNEIMTYNGKAIYSPYHACSAGKTQSSKDVWGGARAWLQSVDSRYDYLADYYNTSKKTYALTPIKSVYKVNKTLTEEQVKTCIQNNLKITVTGSPETWFEFLDENNNGVTSGGYVKKIKVCGKTTTGEKCRTAFSLRSASFNVTYQNGKFTFTTQGYGHGVGLSQWGAHFYADKEGWNYKQILSHYYTGVSISQIG